MSLEEGRVSTDRLVWPISALTGAGLKPLIRWVGRLLSLPLSVPVGDEVQTPARWTTGMPPEKGSQPRQAASESPTAEEADGHVTYRPAARTGTAFTVRRKKEGFVVEGRAVRRLVSRFDLTNEEAIGYLGERLDRLGVYAALRAQGAQPGDDVNIEGYAFEFQ